MNRPAVGSRWDDDCADVSGAAELGEHTGGPFRIARMARYYSRCDMPTIYPFGKFDGKGQVERRSMFATKDWPLMYKALCAFADNFAAPLEIRTSSDLLDWVIDRKHGHSHVSIGAIRFIPFGRSHYLSALVSSKYGRPEDDVRLHETYTAILKWFGEQGVYPIEPLITDSSKKVDSLQNEQLDATSATSFKVPTTTEGRKHFSDYTTATAKDIARIFPEAWKIYERDGGSWGPKLIADSAHLARETVTRYLKVFRALGISEINGITIPGTRSRPE